METLGERLKRLREAKGLTQEGLSKLAGLRNASIVGMLETGKRQRSSHIPALASALGVDALELQFGTSRIPARTGRDAMFSDARIASVVEMMLATDSTGREVALAAVRVALAGYMPARQANDVQ